MQYYIILSLKSLEILKINSIMQKMYYYFFAFCGIITKTNEK